jgi:hypothetical protein
LREVATIVIATHPGIRKVCFLKGLTAINLKGKYQQDSLENLTYLITKGSTPTAMDTNF